MNPDENRLVRSIASRVKEHFDSEAPDEIVRQSRQLVLYPQEGLQVELPIGALDGPVLMHSRPKRVPLNAYLACALTGLTNDQRMLVNHLSDLVNLVCKSVDIDLYEPRKNTDPVHHADVPDNEVFRIDRERVVGSDLLIHLAHFPSTGSGEELTFAFDALVPVIVIAHDSQSVSRMITGIPCLKLEIRYQEPEEMREMLGIRLQEIRPVLEQRKLAKAEFSVNVVGAKIRELRLDASLSCEQLAKSVGLSVDAIEQMEESIDTISNPSLTHLRLIATTLKTTVAELVNPNYTESVLSGIQAILDDRVDETTAARFKGVPTKDQQTILVRYLARLLELVTNPKR
jgi:transcriptional regulator with XRE-family HTH domain